jgi:putative transcription antitermination factor YqgF
LKRQKVGNRLNDPDTICSMPIENVRIAGIDYGTVRIGIALADTEMGIAGPFDNYTRRSAALDGDYFKTLAKEERIGRFVVGLPVHLHGGESQKSTEARAFGKWLGEMTGVPVVAEYSQADKKTAASPPRSARGTDHAHCVSRIGRQKPTVTRVD